MSGFDWGRPRFKTQGRQTESVTGDDLPAAVRSGTRKPRTSKAAMRSDANRAVAEFVRRKGASAIQRVSSAKPGPLKQAAPTARRPTAKPDPNDCPF